jgi:hypothetical protein
MTSYGTFSSEHPVRRAPAPWKLKAESYMLFCKLSELPEGLYDPLEAKWASKGLGEFRGGLGSVMIVRYADTPVGKFLLCCQSMSMYVILCYMHGPNWIDVGEWLPFSSHEACVIGSHHKKEPPTLDFAMAIGYNK